MLRDTPKSAFSVRHGALTRSRISRFCVCLSGLMVACGLACGCTSIGEYVHNGFKVGPNYAPPPAPVARNWIDAADVRVRTENDDLSKWWTVFKDPVLDSLICFAYQQNLSLRVAADRVLEARAQMLIDVGNLFPQTQTATGSYTRQALSREVATSFVQGGRRWYGQWNLGFNLGWEIDFWGRLRRAIESDAANLDASVDNYDDVLVTLLGDVATNYVQYRTTEQRIKYARDNADLQRRTLEIVQGQVANGIVTELDLDQARSTLEQTEAGIPELEIALRQTGNQLCVLLGIPPEDLSVRLSATAKDLTSLAAQIVPLLGAPMGQGPLLAAELVLARSPYIPIAPPDVVVGIPAELLRRRPDVRRAERQAAAQSAQIGIAEAEFYPIISINGTIGYSAAQFKNLFQQRAFTGSFGPTFTWNILNYGRILNNVRLQDARFQELVATYQNTVLSANQDVENGLVQFLRAQERTRLQAASVADAKRAVDLALAQYAAGAVNLTTVTLLQQNLVPLEDTLAQAEGEIGTGLIQVYRALGGGWQIRLSGCDAAALAPGAGDNSLGGTAVPCVNQ